MIFFLLFFSKQISNLVQAEINNKGTLVESQYEPWRGMEAQFDINNLFDDDDTNTLHSSKENPVSDENPFFVLVDMGQIINANMFTIYGSTQNNYNTYQPKKFVLYGGLEKDNLEVFADITDASVVDLNVAITFEAKSFRYYKLVITETYASKNNYVSYRYAKFSIVYPMATPAPDRTQYPGTVQDYINREFEGSVGVEQIQSGTNNIKQISGCRFTNIHDTQKNYYIRIVDEVIIFDNIFENTQLLNDQIAGVFWSDYTGKITISNCTFIRINGKHVEGYVFTSGASRQIQVTMDRCDFIDCGRGGDNQLISLLGTGSSIKLYGCKFNFTTPRVCGVLMIRTNDCLFDRCQFINCASDTILLSRAAPNNEQTTGTFEFTNNHVKNNQGKLINAVRLLTKPIIDNNVFESTTLTNGYYIQLPHNQELIELRNNTFSQITSSGTQDKSSGGVGIFLENMNSNSEFRIKYHECKFYDITNNQGTYPNCQGGALQYGFSDSSNLNCHLEITNCEFRGNKVKQHGGAIAIRTTKSVTIRDCKFESNIANNANTDSELLFSVREEANTNGFGGSIYLCSTFNVNGNDYQMGSASISGCSFKSNQAYQGYAIYIEGSQETDTSIYINDNIFDSNANTQDSTIEGSVVCSEIQTVSRRTILLSNTFVGGDTENTLGSFNYVNKEGEPIPDNEQPPDIISIEIFNTTSDGHYAIDEGMKQTVLVLINISNFTGISYNNGDGGAIRIIDAGVECNKTTFSKCSSSGAGGAIYLSNSYEFLNSMTLNDIYFSENSAQYGGALYIYSVSPLNLVTLTYCNFVANEATAPEAANTKYGGSAAFVTARNSTIMNNHFSDNKGSGPVLRIYNKFTIKKTKGIEPIKNTNKGRVIISNCFFEIGKDSKSCLFYDHGIDDPLVEVVDCKFSGDLAPGSHFIDGQASLNDKSPKLAVKRCKFASNWKDAFNLSPSNKFMTIDLKDQVFSVHSNGSLKMKKFHSLKIVVAVAVPAVVILVVALVIKIVNKKKNNQNNQQEELQEIGDLANISVNNGILI